MPTGTGTVDDPIIADLWDCPGYLVIPTNIDGVHGRGLARQAFDKNLITRYNWDVASSPPDPSGIYTLAVKGWAPETALYPGRSWSERVTGRNLALMEAELERLLQTHQERYSSLKTICAPLISEETWYLYIPFLGMGFGEGKAAEILPILRKFERPWVKFVKPPEGLFAKACYKPSFAPGVRQDKALAVAA